MSATMAREGRQVQLEQSDMCLALKFARMAIEAFLRAAIGEMQYLINKPCSVVREEKKWDVEFPGHSQVKEMIERHPAMRRQTTRPDAFFAKMAMPTIRKHAGDPQQQGHLYLTNSDSRLQSGRHVCVEHHSR